MEENFRKLFAQSHYVFSIVDGYDIQLLWEKINQIKIIKVKIIVNLYLHIILFSLANTGRNY